MASLGPPAQISHEPQSGVGQTAAILRLASERGRFPSSFVGLLAAFLAGCGLEAALCSPSHGLLRRAAHGKGVEAKREGKMEVTVSCDLISEATSHCFCHILFIRGKSLGTAYAQEKEVTRGHECLEVHSWGAVLEVPTATCVSVAGAPSFFSKTI